MEADRIFAPKMDHTFAIDGIRPQRLTRGKARRIAPEAAARPDWHNELSGLLLDIGDAVEKAADERSRKVVIRRLKRALAEADG